MVSSAPPLQDLLGRQAAKQIYPLPQGERGFHLRSLSMSRSLNDDGSSRISYVVFLAIQSAILGTLISSSLLVIYMIYPTLLQNYVPSTSHSNYSEIPLIWIVFNMFGLLFTIPTLIFAGVPISWPFRQIVCKMFLVFAPFYGLIGAGLGWGIGTTLDSRPDDFYEKCGLLYGATTSLAWIFILWCNRAEYLDNPSLDISAQ